MGIKTVYGEDWYMDNGRGPVAIGREENEYLPYDLLYGALSSCYYYTLVSLAKKLRVDYGEIVITIDGKHRDEKIRTLEDVYMKIEAQGVEDKEKFERVCELSGKYCSIHATIAEVARMHHEIIYK